VTATSGQDAATPCPDVLAIVAMGLTLYPGGLRMCGPDYSYRSGESEAARKARQIANAQKDVAYFQDELQRDQQGLETAQRRLASLQSSSN
jgi:hypothetical protein